ncbi:hypothetical protein [Pseudoalteromonas luteoviolacea]|uniref:Lipoprotein n=1 Tax=Pseudoalteromonas luteoviolacea S4054 TaxID=1129367 RepID=A0A0F6ADD6_9GAMM|nr:hypothetical protein [Pseudoalteromonas luteoviolacea]AOT08306.1 hypothetical protein S4054249_10820 [Pseudoalteromonas luteoviolacea]AOT13222.1 hypothetical protein S40542_10795 [Pseudoalteromonas luteoviolacea]AOT18135.1 hypothetical protein S4054_10795 [Pseudoalteromonas luteoviolacea]KKE84242.1 hypothetical protein N479_10105 [Pseudoalteromonas luteoviolacea S4054]KZN76153.1 hypothetical protein N481_07310 [Pseudoalteromonas luteoviolacea S4047-1]
MRKVRFWLVVLACFMLSACQWAKIAHHDPQVKLLLVQTKVRIDMHWHRMLLTEKQSRDFLNYKQNYHAIEVDIQVLKALNEHRAYNSESVTQSENLLKLWRQDISNHQQHNTLGDTLIKRRSKQYNRVLKAMLVAENAKPE